MKNRNFIFLFLAISLMVILVVVGAFVLGSAQNKSLPSPVTFNSPITSNSAPTTATTATTPTTGPTTTTASTTSASQPAPTRSPNNLGSKFLVSDPAMLAQARLDMQTLPVKPAGSMIGYSRDQFGSAWTDNCTTTGCHNSCDTRNDILQRDLVALTFKVGDTCTVMTGTLYDPYTGSPIYFVRGPKSALVQIDHLVPLGNAWISGAQNLTKAQRTNLANDPLNLVAVDGSSNEAKSDSSADSWLPPDPLAHCAYVVHQIEVKTAYHLSTTQAEHNKLAEILVSC